MLRSSNSIRQLTLWQGIFVRGSHLGYKISTSSPSEENQRHAPKLKDGNGSLQTPTEGRESGVGPMPPRRGAAEASTSTYSLGSHATRELWHSECRDRLILSGLCFHGFHGVFEEERRLGQKFMVDVDAWMDLRKAGQSDRLEDSVSYADVYSLVKAVVEGKAHVLLESVAHSIARKILEKHGPIKEVRIRVCKPHVAVSGVVDALGVEIWRRREDLL